MPGHRMEHLEVFAEQEGKHFAGLLPPTPSPAGGLTRKGEGECAHGRQRESQEVEKLSGGARDSPRDTTPLDDGGCR
jgi:hypothetical protein